jgi:hypothetical protein
MITKIGEVISRITTSVKQFGISPHSPVVVRIGDFGPEMAIEHVKVQGGLEPKIVLQLKAVQ